MEFIKNDLDKIKVCDIYNNFNICKINETYNYDNDKDEVQNKNIEKEDKEYIKNIILEFMKYNTKYKFGEIKDHVNIYFKKYKIKEMSILGLMLQMKNKNIVIYKSGRWISNC